MSRQEKGPHGLNTCEPFDCVLLAGEHNEGTSVHPQLQRRAAIFRAEARDLHGAGEHAALSLAAHFTGRLAVAS